MPGLGIEIGSSTDFIYNSLGPVREEVNELSDSRAKYAELKRQFSKVKTSYEHYRALAKGPREPEAKRPKE